MEHGLTAAEVDDRIRRGLVNRSSRSGWLDYAPIIGRNLCTWFNAMVTPAAVALFLLHEYQGAVAVSGMAVVNTALGLVQEVRAKRHLDQLAILVETRCKVVRDGQIHEVPASAVVLGDHVLLAGGEPVVADGLVLDAGFLEVDEALLTGESNPVRRCPGDRLLSGSVCVAGEGTYRADQVGSEAFAHKTAAAARRYHAVASPLTRVINRLVQYLSYTALALIAAYTVAHLLGGGDEAAYVKMVAATITSMVPQGMVLTATLAFTLGAIAMSRRGAVVQRLGAVETMAAIDVLCTDKTGTLTTNHLRLEAVDRLDASLSEEVVRERLRTFASASMDRDNKNLQAIQAALGKASVELREQIPFKAQNCYSAVRVRDGSQERVLVLGAVEAMRGRVEAWERLNPSMSVPETLTRKVTDLQSKGLRLLLLAEADPRVVLTDCTTLPEVPLRPLALISLGDDLRPEAAEVLQALARQGIAVKVLSGDNPETVRGTVSRLDLPMARDAVVSGDQLTGAGDAAALIQSHGVFGRVKPEQKVFIVEALQKSGFHVAMIGDGVNDVLAVKRADLGIAMGQGSQATKTVSGLVLENNNFALLPEALEEGRTIVRNLRRSAKLFLVKNVYSLILILAYASGLFGIPFPYVPQQVTLLNWLVIGMPALVIALSRERSTAATKPRFLREVGWFAVRTGVVFGVAGLAILVLAAKIHPDDDGHRTQRTLFLSVLILLGITALFRALRDGEPTPLVGDRRFRLLGALAIPAYLVAMYVPVSHRFFELVPLSLLDWLWVLLVATPAYGISLLTDRLSISRLFLSTK
jgi:cation-transporting ATPase E